jgi:uncharacterized protein YcfJ
MKTKTYLFTVIFGFSSLATAATFQDNARVLNVEKIYRTHTIQEPYKDCYIEQVEERLGDGSITNEVIGGIFGGLVGNQFGSGNGKDAATLAGTILGASLAHDDELKKTNKTRILSQEVCETKYRTRSEERLSHYLVEYEYEGRKYSYKSNRMPSSDTIQVRVSVNPS